jgi:hypothetical protein
MSSSEGELKAFSLDRAAQAHAASVALNDQAVTVVLDFMEPDRSRWDDPCRWSGSRVNRYFA